MREILFRGKCNETCKYKGQWIEGFYGEDDGKPIIVRSTGPGFGYFCEPNSIGQYTGLTDKNGLTKIFEYDIIDANGRKAGNYYENSNLLKDGTCLLVARMGTKEWSRSEQEAIKRGCKYAE